MPLPFFRKVRTRLHSEPGTTVVVFFITYKVVGFSDNSFLQKIDSSLQMDWNKFYQNYFEHSSFD